MQAYEHIMVTMLKLSKSSKDSKGLSLENNLAIMKQYGAFFTYPDSIRALVRASTGKAYRQPSHMSEGAWMEFIFGDELKNVVDGYPLDKMHIPDTLELKAADGPTDINLAIEHNQEHLDTREMQAILEHLRQDKINDKLFQGYIATCYIDENDESVEAGDVYSLYGVTTKAGLARLNQTGKIVPMSEFRKIVSLTQQLTTFELFKRLRQVYPDLTFDQIKDSIFASYDEYYPSTMMNAKTYAVPKDEEQERILLALDTGDYSYYDNLKQSLVDYGAFKSVEDVTKETTGLIDSIVSVPDKEIDSYDFEF